VTTPRLPMVLALILIQEPIPKGAAPPIPAPAPAAAGPSAPPQAPATGATPVVLDFKAQPVAQAIRALHDRTGGMVDLLGVNDPSWAEKRVALESAGPVPMLDAIDRFSAAAGIRHSLTWAGPFGQPRPHIQFQAGAPSAADGPGPGAYVGPFRLGPVVVHEHFDRVFLRAKLPPSVLVEATPAFYADIPILAEPELLYIRTGPIRNLEAVDEAGRSCLDPKLGGEAPILAVYQFDYQNARAVRLALERPAGGTGKALATLRGVVPLEVARRPTAPTLVVPLDGASGRTFRDGEITVVVREARADNQGPTSVKLTVRLEGPRGQADPKLKGLLEARLWSVFYHQLELVDALGKPVALSGSGGPSSRGELNLDYTYTTSPPGSKGYPPTHLRVFRPGWAAWDLPFEFRDVPLP